MLPSHPTKSIPRYPHILWLIFAFLIFFFPVQGVHAQAISITQEASVLSSLQLLLSNLQQQLLSLLQTTNYGLRTTD